ncbi:kinetochore and Eb1-associated basic protein [Drosophila eugracilis]|uniref:kinetochore and Eb1-associated basic protein n=1 Tax=Drosophila eugracilis TaxID=29029 RepID=UPI0007E85F6D|nr:kinetochore and Eb1-associated basic protein [Drosophila eugracilis]
MDNITRSPDVRIPECGMPLRIRELMERMGSHKGTTYKSIPSIIITRADIIPERSKLMLQRLEGSLYRSPSAPKNAFLTSVNKKQKERLKIPKDRCPLSEPQPIRPKVILERERQEALANRMTSISIDRPRTRPPTNTFTSSRQLVPSIGFSYPKDPKSLQRSAKTTELTNTKRKLDFHTDVEKASLRPKLEKIAKEWHTKTEYQLRQFISELVNHLAHFMPLNGVKFSYLSRGSYVQQIMEALQHLQYSKKVNKTWLRMPNTQQAMGHLLEILYFLLDAVEKGEGMAMLPPVSKEQSTLKERQATSENSEQKIEFTNNDIIALHQQFDNLKIQKESNNSQVYLNGLLDAQEEKLHELQIKRLVIMQFSELVSLAKIKLKRCCDGNQENINAFNQQIRDLTESHVFKNSLNASSLQLHLNPNPTLEGIVKRMEQLQRLYEENYLNLQQLNM